MAGEVTPAVRLSDDELANVASFQDAMNLVNERFGGEIIDVAQELGTGFSVLDDKARLIGVPFIILEARESEGDYTRNGEPGTFVSLTLVCDDRKGGGKFIVNDGGTGIRDQLLSYWKNNPDKCGTTAEGMHYSTVPFLVRNGLSRSSYYRDPKTGDVSRKQQDGYEPAETYYLDLTTGS